MQQQGQQVLQAQAWMGFGTSKHSAPVAAPSATLAGNTGARLSRLCLWLSPVKLLVFMAPGRACGNSSSSSSKTSSSTGAGEGAITGDKWPRHWAAAAAAAACASDSLGCVSWFKSW